MLIIFLFPLIISAESQLIGGGKYSVTFEVLSKKPDDIKCSTLSDRLKFFQSIDYYNKAKYTIYSGHCLDLENKQGICLAQTREKRFVEYFLGNSHYDSIYPSFDNFKVVGVNKDYYLYFSHLYLTIHINEDFFEKLKIDKFKFIKTLDLEKDCYCFPGDEGNFYVCDNQDGISEKYVAIKIKPVHVLPNTIKNSFENGKPDNQSSKKSNTKSKILNLMAIFLGGVCFLAILNMIRLSLKSD